MAGAFLDGVRGSDPADLARPRLHELNRHQGGRDRQGKARLLHGRLRGVRRAAPAGRSPARGGGQAPDAGTGADRAVHQPLPVQGVQSSSGAEPYQGSRTRREGRTPRPVAPQHEAFFPHPTAGLSCGVRDGRRRFLVRRQTRLQRSRPDDRASPQDRHRRTEWSGQVNAPEAPSRRADAGDGRAQDQSQDPAGLFRTTSDRGVGSRQAHDRGAAGGHPARLQRQTPRSPRSLPVLR